MALSQADVAVNIGNQVMNIVQQIKNLRPSIAEIVKVNATTPLGNLWNALHTTTLNSDGTLGTPDAGAPVPADPIDPLKYPAMSRVVKATDLANALQLVVDISAFLDGTAMAANGARPANINAVAM